MHMMNEGGETQLYSLIQQQTTLYQEALENHRKYVLDQLDLVRAMLSQNYNKDEIKNQLDVFRGELVRMQGDLSGLTARISQVEQNITAKMEQIAARQAELTKQMEERQSESYRRVITMQSTILLFVITTIVGLAINFIFHR